MLSESIQQMGAIANLLNKPGSLHTVGTLGGTSNWKELSHHVTRLPSVSMGRIYRRRREKSAGKFFFRLFFLAFLLFTSPEKFPILLSSPFSINHLPSHRDIFLPSSFFRLSPCNTTISFPRYPIY